jgi:hypothetical protein
MHAQVGVLMDTADEEGDGMEGVWGGTSEAGLEDRVQSLLASRTWRQKLSVLEQSTALLERLEEAGTYAGKGRDGMYHRTGAVVGNTLYRERHTVRACFHMCSSVMYSIVICNSAQK